MAGPIRSASSVLGGLNLLLVVALSGCGDAPSHRLHSQIVALDALGTPGWRTGPGEVESSRLKEERLVLADGWFPAGTPYLQATRALVAEGYDLSGPSEGWISGQRKGRFFCRPGSEIHLRLEGGRVSRAEVKTIPSLILYGGAVC